MELQARKKKQEAVPLPLRPASPAPTVPPHEEKSRGVSEVITIRCNTLLYNTIQNMIISAHIAQDFAYKSPSDFIRAALLAYRDGMELTELEERGDKIGTTIRVDLATKVFYTSLPDRLRTKLLERAIRTLLKRQL